ncbi:DNA-binding protein YbaB [Kribbella amoyensis]|uniref:DNA-binding protein YbaB n=1 Tax=Kribbella amoyensis TaxID=996641 RepID=A0A561BR23_9ACTN|nr:YbaB/EbfC family nucleoid-associated protein [Kribbella amoyensis]TWD81326.1 DNA-binding protein YbaB [Kribbella amoyensis]
MGPTDPAAGEALSLLGQLDVTEREVRRLRSMNEDTTGTAQSPDGLIEATVGMYGEVRELVLDPRIFRNPDAEALADQLRDVLNEAVREAQTSAARQLSTLLPNGIDGPAGLAFEPLLEELTRTRKAARR